MKYLLTILILFCLVPSIASAALADNLVSYWKLDESSGNATDSHSSNTLTNNNTATYSTGKINNAVYLASASSQSLSITDNASLSITGDLSISGWFYFTSFSANGRKLVNKWNDTGNQRGFIFDNSDASGDTLRLVLSTNGVNFPLVTATGAALSVDTWYHLAVTFKASTGVVSFYKNGSLLFAPTISANSIFDNTADFYIGNGVNAAPTDPFNGRVDEVGIWSRELTSGEITTLYNGGAGNQYPFTIATTIFYNFFAPIFFE